MVKKASTRRKKRVKREDEEPEVEEEEDDLDEELEDEEEEEKPKRKKKKKVSRKKEKEEDEDEDEEDDDPDFAVRSGKSVKQMLTNPSKVDDGEYELEIKGLKTFKATQEKPRGILRVNFDIVEGAGDEPEDGWPTQSFDIPMYRFKWVAEEKLKGAKQNQKFGERDGWKIVFAALGEDFLEDEDEMTLPEALKEAKGSRVMASGKYDGEWDRMEWGGFKPV